MKNIPLQLASLEAKIRRLIQINRKFRRTTRLATGVAPIFIILSIVLLFSTTSLTERVAVLEEKSEESLRMQQRVVSFVDSMERQCDTVAVWPVSPDKGIVPPITKTKNDKTTPVVYICTGPYSYAYHTDRACELLNQCGSKIEEISQSRAREIGRLPCMACVKTERK